MHKIGASLTLKLVGLVGIFAALPIVLYGQFESADRQMRDLVTRAIQDRSRMIGHALAPALDKVNAPGSEQLNAELAKFAIDGTVLRLMLQPAAGGVDRHRRRHRGPRAQDRHGRRASGRRRAADAAGPPALLDQVAQQDREDPVAVDEVAGVGGHDRPPRCTRDCCRYCLFGLVIVCERFRTTCDGPDHLDF